MGATEERDPGGHSPTGRTPPFVKFNQNSICNFTAAAEWI